MQPTLTRPIAAALKLTSAAPVDQQPIEQDEAPIMLALDVPEA